MGVSYAIVAAESPRVGPATARTTSADILVLFISCLRPIVWADGRINARGASGDDRVRVRQLGGGLVVAAATSDGEGSERCGGEHASALAVRLMDHWVDIGFP